MTLIAELARAVDAEKVTSTDLRAVIDTTERRRVDAENTLEQLLDRREGALLRQSDAAVRKIDDEVAGIRLAIERCAATSSLLRERLAIVEAAEADAAREAERAQIEQRVQAAAKRLQNDYVRHATALREIVGELAETDLAIRAFAARHPNEPAIVSAEQRVRHAPEERRVVQQTETWVWKAPNGRLSDDEMTQDVRPESVVDARPSSFPRMRRADRPRGGNYLTEIEHNRADPNATYRTGLGAGVPVKAVRAIRRVVEVMPPIAPPPLWKTLALPELRRGAPSYTAPSFADPRAVLAALAAPPAERPVETKVEYQEIEEDRDDHAA